MSYRSSPAFAVGGVSWLNAQGEPGNCLDPTPTGWRCFHCNMHFMDGRAALRHFGYPQDQKKPVCMNSQS